MIKKCILWILVILCAGAIFFFSSQEAPDSDRASSGLIISLVRLFDIFDKLSEKEIIELSVSLNGVVRTCAHFTIFGIMGFFVTLLYSAYDYKGLKLLIFSVASSFLYACSDELHQHFVPGRSAQVEDIVVDTLGALIAALAVMIIIKFMSLKKTQK